MVAMDSFQFSVEDTAHTISLPVNLAIDVHSSLGAVSKASESVMTIENTLSSFQVIPISPSLSDDIEDLWL